MDNFLPGSASLVDCVDKKLLVVLRDGRNLVGVLRSYDQFANLVLQDTIERTYHNDTYGDEYRGVFVIRGENVVLLGEVDVEREDSILKSLQQGSPDAVVLSHRAEQEERRKRDQQKFRILHEHGFSVNIGDNDTY
ncbi:Sm-like ribonucleoprotein [Cladochytrium replicatum]|nr:Sm-like ribonucleoprotein [Cladochytrium replicatum]